MFIARIFKTGEIVEAQEVFDGKYDRHENFVDVEENFRVVFVSRAKNNGRPYFRWYYSLEDYRRLHPDKADRYEILRNLRFFQETDWHIDWKAKFASFCETEKITKNSNYPNYKKADVFYQETNTCIELQHSFIDYDFEERNKFYKELGINIIWLYDLTHLDVKPMDDGAYYILEDNAKGFFRIAENADNLRNNYVFVQAKDGKIYQVMVLFRKETDNGLKSTVRYFYPISIDTEAQFIKKIESDEYRKQREQMMQVAEETLSELKNYSDLFSLWKPGYRYMIVCNMITNVPIIISESPYKKGTMETNRFHIPPAIICRYMIQKNNKLIPDKTPYVLRDDDAKKPIWKLLDAQ